MVRGIRELALLVDRRSRGVGDMIERTEVPVESRNQDVRS